MLILDYLHVFSINFKNRDKAQIIPYIKITISM